MNVVGVEFKSNGKVYYFDKNKVECYIDDNVLVDTEKGLEFAKVVSQKKVENIDNMSLAKVIRKANDEDIKKYNKNNKDAEKVLEYAEKTAKKLDLSMSFIGASFTFERNQLLISYISDSRVDFRELAKELASVYKTRIELRQVGVRDKAKDISGLGQCGRQLCCSSFLNDLDSVSISMAKNQNLVLNPTKINGQCGRLLCCLNYEDKVYSEYRKKLPSIGEIVDIKEGTGKVIGLDILNQKYVVDVENKEKVEVCIKKEQEYGKNNK